MPVSNMYVLWWILWLNRNTIPQVWLFLFCNRYLYSSVHSWRWLKNTDKTLYCCENYTQNAFVNWKDVLEMVGIHPCPIPLWAAYPWKCYHLLIMTWEHPVLQKRTPKVHTSGILLEKEKIYFFNITLLWYYCLSFYRDLNHYLVQLGGGSGVVQGGGHSLNNSEVCIVRYGIWSVRMLIYSLYMYRSYSVFNQKIIIFL